VDILNSLFEIHFCGICDVTGYIVVDSIVGGTSSGGVRIVPDLEIEEVRMLAAEMTLKYAFCGLPRGGAKCGIRIPAHLDPQQRAAALEDVGRRLRAIITAGIYYPGMDMNCGPDELGAIYRGAGFKFGAMTDTSFYTAVFAAEAVRACADILFAEKIGPLTLSVEGFGKVASHLAVMLEPDRFRIVALSTVGGAVHNPDGFPPAELARARSAHRDAMVDHLSGTSLASRDDALFQSVDILVPAARVGSIHAGNVDHVAARCVVSVANAPCSAEALERLHQRRIPVLPGFVCNAGGVLGSSLFDRGVGQAEVQRLAAGPYRETVSELLRRSLALDVPPTELARSLAHDLIRARGEQPLSRAGRLLAALTRRFTLARLYVNRHAARDCARHFVRVTESVRRLKSDLIS
jgi:glutamate dehydrogenase/leucine dehydrogenase